MRPLTLALFLFAGCGDGGFGNHTDAGTDAGVDSGPAPCNYTRVRATSGRVLGPDGQPIEGATVGFCMRNDETSICFQPVPTAADGTYSIEVPEDFSCVMLGVDRISAEGMALNYCTLDLSSVADDAIAAPDFSLFAVSGSAPDWGAGADDEITYAADDGGSVTLKRSDVLAAAVETDLRMTWVDPTVTRPCFVPEGQEVASLYAMTPETDVLRDGGLPARLFDHAGLPAGTPVDLYTLGSLVSAVPPDEILEGSWEAFAESTVGADGFIDTPVGDGLPQIGWIGAVPR